MKHLLLGALAAGSTHAQQPAPVASTIFLNYWSEPVPEAQAAYRVRRTETPGTSRLDSVYRLTSPRLWNVQRTTWQANGDILLTTTQWRPDGRLWYASNKLGTRLHGEQLSYDADGQLRSRSRYEKDRKVSTECLAKGAVPPCDGPGPGEKAPEYPGGMNGMLRYLGQSIRYPAESLRRNRQGKVLVQFVVNEAGELRDIRLQQGVSPELDAEALRVVHLMPRWEPARLNGEPVPVQYTVPIIFAIQ